MSTPEHVHICLVSDQLLPNLLPVLAQRPQRVLLMVTAAMAERARRFAGILAQHGIASELRSGVPDAGLARIEETALELAASLDRPGVRLTLNLTGGTKLMTLGFHRVFVEQLGDRTEAIYTDTTHGCIEVVHPPRQPVRALGELLDLRTALAAQGATVTGMRSESREELALLKHRAPLTETLVREFGGAGGWFLPILNALARAALDHSGQRLVAPVQVLERAPGARLWQLLEQCAALGLIRLESRSALEFLDDHSARYLCGGWLEDHAWLCAHAVQPHRYGCGVQVNWDGDGRGPLPNEFDLLAVHRNRLLVVECKTARFGTDTQKDADRLYKLDSLADAAGGLFGKALLLSARELPEELHKRARRQRIEVLDGARISGFAGWLAQWMKVS